jgi:hypothetical protein
MEGATGVEVLLDSRKEILAVAIGFLWGSGVDWLDPRVLQSLVSGHSLSGVDGQAASDELASGLGDVAPVFDGCERIVCGQNGLHFFEIGVPVERGIAAEEEVCDDADGPDVAVVMLVRTACGWK